MGSQYAAVACLGAGHDRIHGRKAGAFGGWGKVWWRWWIWLGSAVGAVGADASVSMRLEVEMGLEIRRRIREWSGPGFVAEKEGMAGGPVPRHRTWEAVGDGAGLLGSSAATGDVDGDGVSELLLGAPRGGRATDSQGLVFMISGGPTSSTASPIRLLAGRTPGERLGSTMVFGEFPVGQRRLWLGGLRGDQGGVLGWHPFLNPGVMASGLEVKIHPPEPHPVGKVELPGDVNGDGHPELLICYPRSNRGATNGGLVQLVSMRDPDAPAQVVWEWIGDQPGEQVGYRAAVGDFNRDGFGDVAVGAQGFDPGNRPEAGRVLVFHGSPHGLQLVREYVAPEAWQRLGVSLGVGDLDGDQWPELVVGGRGQPDRLMPMIRSPDRSHEVMVVPGRVWVFRGGPEGWGSEPDQVLTATDVERSFGRRLEVVPGFYGPSMGAVFVGASHDGEVHLKEGRIQSYGWDAREDRVRLTAEWRGNRADFQLGEQMCDLGDWDGDGYGDVAFGSPKGWGLDRARGRVDVWFGGPMLDGPAPRWLAVVGEREGDYVVGAQRGAEARVMALDAKEGLRDGETEEAGVTGPIREWEGPRLSGTGVGGAGKAGLGSDRWQEAGVAGALGAVLLLAAGWPWVRGWQRRHETRAAAATATAVAQERDRLARDLHDELGGHLARLTKLFGKPSGKGAGGERDRHAAQVARTVREALVSMDRLVWEVKPGHDTLPALVNFLAQYVTDLLEDTGIGLQLDLPLDPPKVPLTQAQRRHLLPMIKEALANVLKHSGADRVELSMRCDDRWLVVSVCDNGRGFDAEGRGESGGEQDGLGNLKARAEEMGGSLDVVSELGEGTLIRWRVPRG